MLNDSFEPTTMRDFHYVGIHLNKNKNFNKIKNY